MANRQMWVVASGASFGRCRYCGARILWVTTAAAPGKPARSVAFTVPVPQALATDRNDETGVRFEAWPTAALHVVTCREQPERKRVRQVAR